MPVRAYAVALALLAACVGAGPARAQGGALDLTFAADGQATTPFDLAGVNDQGRAVAVQADGKIVVAGYARVGTTDDFALVRYNADGTLDATFGGGDGRVTTAVGTGLDQAQAVALQPDGKIVAAGSARIGSTFDFALARYNADGTLDGTFGGGDGLVTTAVGAGDDVARAVALQPDGGIVVAGNAVVGSPDDFALARYDANGALDPTFSGDGKLTTDFAAGPDIAYAVAVQPDGRIVAAGFARIGSADDFALARYDANGALDATFGGGDGLVTTAVAAGTDQALAVAVQPDGKIVAAGLAQVGSTLDFALARYTSGGALDATFSGDGLVTTAVGTGSDVAFAVAVQADGGIVAAGYALFGGTFDFALARYTSGGSPDPTFSGDGKLTTDFAAGTDVAYAVAVQADGRIVAAGYATVGSTDDFALARYDANGALDATFGGGDGLVTTGQTGPGSEQARAVAVQPDGKIVVAGYTLVGSTDDFALARYNADGSLDTSFGTGGLVTMTFGTSGEQARAVAVQPDGKIVVAGFAFAGDSEDFALARYHTDGSLDTGFGTGGRVTTAIGTGQDIATAVALQADGKIVVAGYAIVGVTQDFALARYNADGTLDTGFGTGGKTTTAFGTAIDEARAVAIQADGRIVAAGYATVGSTDDFALARYTSGGALDATFGTGGLVTTDFGVFGNDIANAVALQPDGRIVAAGSAFAGSSTTDFALVRYDSNGALDATFGTGGKVSTNFGTGTDQALAVALQADGRIVAAGFSLVGSPATQDFALARYDTNGSLDATFDTDGKVTTPFGTSTDQAYAVALQADGRIVAAGYARIGSTNDFALARYLPGDAPTFATTVTGTAGTGNDAGWRMLSAPTSDATRTGIEDDVNLDALPGFSLLYTYSGSAFVATPPGGALPSGKGFIVYLADNAADPVDPDKTLDLTGYSPTALTQATGLGTNDRWHLVGNPFAADLDLSWADLVAAGFQSTIHVWEPDGTGGGAYVTRTQAAGATDVVAAWQGFWAERSVLGSGSTTLSLLPAGRTIGGVLVGGFDEPIVTERRVLDGMDGGPESYAVTEGDGALVGLALTLRDAAGATLSHDAATALFLDGAQAGWDPTDGSKLTPLASAYASLAFENEREGEPALRALDALPAEFATAALPIRLRAVGLSGEATLTWPRVENVPAGWRLMLDDRLMGESVNLREQTSYSFPLAPEDGASPEAPLSMRAAESPYAAWARGGADGSAGDPARFVLRVDAAIPVELTALTGIADGAGAVRLTWATASETNNAGFEVQALRAGTWTPLAFVDGAGTSNEAHAYALRVENMAVGAHAFRLKQVDLDGAFALSAEVEVTVGVVGTHLLSAPYPNPFAGRSQLTLAVARGQHVRAELFDALGRRAAVLFDGDLAADVSHALSLDGRALASGLYVVRVVGESFRETRRVTVLR